MIEIPPPAITTEFAVMKARAVGCGLVLAYVPATAPDGTRPGFVTNLSRADALLLVSHRTAQRNAENQARAAGKPLSDFIAMNAQANVNSLIRDLYYPAQAATVRDWMLLLLMSTLHAPVTEQIQWLANSHWLQTSAVLPMLYSVVYAVPPRDWVAY